jgi:CRP-like cAMP-binding protein
MPHHKVSGLERLFLRIGARERLSTAELQALTDAASERRHFSAGHDLVTEGDSPKTSTLLLEGMASRYNLLEDGRRQITAVHISGDFVDLQSFPLPKMDHSIGALTDCEVLTFPHSSLREITEEQPGLARSLWMLTLLDAAIHRRWLVAMGRMSALGHMAHFVCEMYLRLEAVGMASGNRMNFPIKQSELADILGLSAVHANRILQELRKLHVLRWDGNDVEIMNWNSLTALGEFDDAYLFQDRHSA